MFALVVRFDLPDPEAADAFDRLVREAVPGILAEEDGTLVYTAHEVVDDALARVFYEVYRDRAAHAAHEARPATGLFLQRVGELISGLRVEQLAPLDLP